MAKAGQMKRDFLRVLIVAAAICIPTVSLQAQGTAKASETATRDAADLTRFAQKAALQKELGATHVLITEGLPEAAWELDEGDPYPAWSMHHTSLMKVFPPAEVEPFVNAEYAVRLRVILQKRCEILRKLGLKAVWNTNEPAVMPEAFFTAHPELRGPRIDQANRSRKVYFSMSVDEPETLRLYRASIQMLLKSCPEVEQFNWVTTDAGSGFDWTPSLYPGINGNSKFRDRPIADRVSGFLINAQTAARDVGHEILINLNPIEARQWMLPTFSPDVLENIVRKLPHGLAVEGHEGPDGRRFTGVMGGGGGGGGAFSPVVGIVVPQFDAGGRGSRGNDSASARMMVNLGDAASMDFNIRLLKFTHNLPMRTLTERVTALRAFAASEAGEEQADNLMEAWSALNDVQRNLQVLDFGPMLTMGHVLNRWVTRPMVPFPAELTAAEKQDYRKFLFQAKGEEQAENLIDIQAMRMYEGWGAKMLFQRTVELSLPKARRALTLVDGIAAAAKDEAQRKQWELTGKRIQAVIYLLESADNMVAYQAQLDRVKSLGIKPEPNPVLGVQSSWDRTDLMETARKEIDAMVGLHRLLESTKEPILDLAQTREEETIRRLGPDVSAQIKHKIDVMNAHWRDYDRLFTVPNP